MLRPVLLAVLACALAACVRPSAGSPGPTGSPAPGVSGTAVSGQVTAGPVCPVERYPPASACADRAVSGALLLIDDANGRQVAEVRSAADGSFRVDLQPGSYRIVPQPVAGLMGTAAPIDVQVTPGASSSPIAVQYDTGIR